MDFNTKCLHPKREFSLLGCILIHTSVNLLCKHRSLKKVEEGNRPAKTFNYYIAYIINTATFSI